MVSIFWWVWRSYLWLGLMKQADRLAKNIFLKKQFLSHEQLHFDTCCASISKTVKCGLPSLTRGCQGITKGFSSTSVDVEVAQGFTTFSHFQYEVISEGSQVPQICRENGLGLAVRKLSVNMIELLCSCQSDNDNNNSNHHHHHHHHQQQQHHHQNNRQRSWKKNRMYIDRLIDSTAWSRNLHEAPAAASDQSAAAAGGRSSRW